MATSDDSWTNLSAPAQVGVPSDEEKVIRRFQIPLAMAQQYDRPKSRQNRSQRSVHFSDGTDSWKQLSNGVLRDFSEDEDDYVRSEISDETHSSDTTHGVEEIEDTMDFTGGVHSSRSRDDDGEGMTAAELLKSYSELPVEMEYDDSLTDTVREDSKDQNNMEENEETVEKENASRQRSSPAVKEKAEDTVEEKVTEVNGDVDEKEAEEEEINAEEGTKEESTKKVPAFIERLQDTMKSSYTRMGMNFEPCPWLSFEKKVWSTESANDIVYAAPEVDTSSSYRLENIHFKRRQNHAFVAPPGSGKSQAASLLCRLYGRWEMKHFDDHFTLLIFLKPAMLQKAENSIELFVWQTFLKTDGGATYQDLAEWMDNNSKRILFVIDVDTNEQDVCRQDGTLKSLLRRDLFQDSTVLVFSDGLFLSDWAITADFEVASIFHLTGWRNDDIERQVLHLLDQVKPQSPSSRALEALRDALTNTTVEDCCSQNAALLALLLASDDHADQLDIPSLVKGLGPARGNIYGLLVERAALSIEVDGKDDKETSGQRAKSMKKSMSNRWTFVENNVSPDCYLEGSSFQCGEFRARSRDFDEYCAARHLHSLYYKALRDSVMGGHIRHSEWWTHLKLCWNMEDQPETNTHFGYTLPFLAAMMKNEPEEVLAPLKDLYKKFSPEAKQRCNLICRRCLLEVGDEVESWEKALVELVGRRRAAELLSDPSSSTRRDENEEDCKGDGESDKGHRGRKKRKSEDVERLIGRVGDTLALNFNDLTRSMLGKDDIVTKSVDLLEPLASLVEALKSCTSLRKLVVEFNVDTIPADAFPILTNFFTLEFPDLRQLELIISAFRCPRWSFESNADKLGIVLESCSDFIARSKSLKKLSLTGAFLSSDMIISPLRESIIDHPSLRSLTVEGHEGGSSVHRRAVYTMESIIRDHGWRELHLDSSNFNRLTSVDTMQQNNYIDSLNSQRSGLNLDDHQIRQMSQFNGFSLGGVGSASWVSCLRRSRCPLSSSPVSGRSWSPQCTPDYVEEPSQPEPLPEINDSETEVLKILRGADGHQRLHHVHVYAGHISSVVHGVFLDTLIGCRHLKTFSLSCQRLDDSLMGAISSGVTCAVHLQSIGVEGRWSTSITGGGIFGLTQAACAAGSVQSVRIKGHAMNAMLFHDLPFALGTILSSSPPKEELEITLEGEVISGDERQQEIVDSLSKCETHKNIIFNANLTMSS